MPKKDKYTFNCIYHKNKNGMGGVAVDIATKTKIFIAPDLEKFALDQDEVIVRLNSGRDEYLQGEIVQITKHNTTHLVGFVQFYRPRHLLRVNNPKFGQYLVYINTHIDKVNRDELIKTVIIAYPDEGKPFFEVEILNYITARDEDHAYIEKIIAEAELPIEFTKEALIFAEKLPKKVLSKEVRFRRDLRHLPFVTIDGEDAKDFDDAVYCETRDGLFYLFVAIADVAHYVVDNSPLEEDAYLRGTSVYLPKLVIPMLPDILSNGLCSLNPNVDRLSICCEITINSQGEIIDYRIDNAIIHSHARLTYSEVQEWINDLTIIPNDLVPTISSLYLVYKALLIARNNRGAIDFDSVEALFNFDENGMVSELIPRVRLESHRLIEECMLAANVTIADFLICHNQPTLFRIHEKPTLEKFIALKDYLNSLAIKFEVNYEKLTPRDYLVLLEGLREHIDFTAIQTAVLRSMQLALYSPNNIGHFGLSYNKYLHFTSPIRRYPDLLVHRAVKSVINSMNYSYHKPLVLIGEHASITERRAEELGRKADSFYKCQYARGHIGSVYAGVITSVVAFGVFVYMPELLIEGLVHVSELGNEYFTFDQKSLVLVSVSSGIRFVNGQKVEVEITGVNMAKLFIDLKIA